MGNNKSTPDKCGVVRQEDLYHFQKIEILKEQEQDSEFFIQTYQFLIGPDIQQAFIQSLQKRNNECLYLIQMKSIQLKSAGQCSNSTLIQVAFQYFPSTIQSLIERGHNFTQRQICNIFACLLKSVRHLNSNGSYHGDISPQFIYIDFNNLQKEPIYKIFDSAYFKPKKNGYHRAQRQKVFCAPQILTNLGDKRIYPIYNHQIADTFSIGLVILYCMTLVSPLQAYTNKNEIDSYFIESMFRIANRKQYSQELISATRQCLRYRNRPNASETLIHYRNIFESVKENVQESSNAKFSLKKSRIGLPCKNKILYY